MDFVVGKANNPLVFCGGGGVKIKLTVDPFKGQNMRTVIFGPAGSTGNRVLPWVTAVRIKVKKKKTRRKTGCGESPIQTKDKIRSSYS